MNSLQQRVDSNYEKRSRSHPASRSRSRSRESAVSRKSFNEKRSRSRSPSLEREENVPNPVENESEESVQVGGGQSNAFLGNLSVKNEQPSESTCDHGKKKPIPAYEKARNKMAESTLIFSFDADTFWDLRSVLLQRNNKSLTPQIVLKMIFGPRKETIETILSNYVQSIDHLCEDVKERFAVDQKLSARELIVRAMLACVPIVGSSDKKAVLGGPFPMYMSNHTSSKKPIVSVITRQYSEEMIKCKIKLNTNNTAAFEFDGIMGVYANLFANIANHVREWAAVFAFTPQRQIPKNSSVGQKSRQHFWSGNSHGNIEDELHSSCGCELSALSFVDRNNAFYGTAQFSPHCQLNTLRQRFRARACGRRILGC